jgi:hypothetical protein
LGNLAKSRELSLYNNQFSGPFFSFSGLVVPD